MNAMKAGIPTIRPKQVVNNAWLIPCEADSTMFVSPTIAQIISYLSMNDHLASLAKGVVDTEDIIYFLVFTGLFLFLTLRSLESNRWR